MHWWRAGTLRDIVSLCLGDQFKVYHPSFGLRQKMLTLIQNLSYYMMVEVVEPAWHALGTDFQILLAVVKTLGG